MITDAPKQSLMAFIAGTNSKAGQALFVIMGVMACFVLLGLLIIAPSALDYIGAVIRSPYWLLGPILPLLFIAISGIL